MLDLIGKMVRLLTTQRAVGQSLGDAFRNGYSIASTEIIHNICQYTTEILTVIDVGANQGQFAIASARGFQKATIYSFEPLPDVYPVLQKNVSTYPQIKSFNMALGSSNGVIDFYRNSHSHASSALPISTYQQTQLPETANTEKIQVSVQRLDQVRSELTLTRPVLLKLDVQGYEKEVLEGASAMLDQVDYLVFETSFVPMYEGEPVFNEMHEYVKSKGFELIVPVGSLQNKTGQYLQLDVLYGRKS